MERKWSVKSSVICMMLMLALVMFVSCGKKTVETDPTANQDAQQETPKEDTTSDDAATDVQEDEMADASTDTEENNDAEEMAALREDFENVTIRFAYDSSAIIDSEIQTLEGKADWLRNNPDVTITIEGHCDERGTTEYNLALGDRRAARVKGFLVNLGIDAERVTTVSYGEERPAVEGSGEAVWAKNRRAEFKID